MLIYRGTPSGPFCDGATNWDKENAMANRVKVTAQNIADYIVSKENICPLKLQKLLYYSQAAYLVNYKKPLFDDKIEAWDRGPVVEGVYRTFKNEGFNSEDVITPIKKTRLPYKARKTVDLVIKLYKDWSGEELVWQTHNEGPWKSVYEKDKNNFITNESLISWFEDVFKYRWTTVVTII